MQLLTPRGTIRCRSCGDNLGETLLSLGSQPLSNALVNHLSSPTDPRFPLNFKICQSCGLGQIGEYVSPDEIFSDYTYFSSASSSWLNHARIFAKDATSKFSLSQDDLVMEIASNDGYLLKYFKELGVNVLGIEPAANVASYANSIGIPTEVKFFGEETAIELLESGYRPRLVICNNVLAHVPDINDFMMGLAKLVEYGAVISIEAPSMLTMLENNLFDTIYHEHFSYLSVHSVNLLASKCGLRLVNVDYLPTHGGSYRFWISSTDTSVQGSVQYWMENEGSRGLLSAELGNSFALKAKKVINDFSAWVKLNSDEKIVGFGAAAKATVLLNASQIESHQILAVADNGKGKQNKAIPGCRIPIMNPKDVFYLHPKKIVIFPWNIADELVSEIRLLDKNIEIWAAVPEMKYFN